MFRPFSPLYLTGIIASVLSCYILVVISLIFVDPNFPKAFPNSESLLKGAPSIGLIIIWPSAAIFSLIISIGTLCKTPSRQLIRAWLPAIAGFVALAVAVNIVTAKIWFSIDELHFKFFSLYYLSYLAVHFLVYLGRVIYEFNRKKNHTPPDGRNPFYRRTGIHIACYSAASCSALILALIINNYYFHNRISKVESIVWTQHTEPAIQKINSLAYNPLRIVLPFGTQARIMGLEGDRQYYHKRFDEAKRHYELERDLLRIDRKLTLGGKNIAIRIDETYWEDPNWRAWQTPLPARPKLKDDHIPRIQPPNPSNNLFEHLKQAQLAHEDDLHKTIVKQGGNWKNEINYLAKIVSAKEVQINSCIDTLNLRHPYFSTYQTHNFSQPLLHVHAQALVAAHQGNESLFLKSTEALYNGLESLENDGTFHALISALNTRVAFAKQTQQIIKSGNLSRTTIDEVKNLILNHQPDQISLERLVTRAFWSGKQRSQIKIIKEIHHNPEYQKNKNLRSYWQYISDTINHNQMIDTLAFFSDEEDVDTSWIKPTYQLEAEQYKVARPFVYHWLRSDVDYTTAIRKLWIKEIDMHSRISVSYPFPITLIKEKFDLALQLEASIINDDNAKDVEDNISFSGIPPREH